MRSPTPTIIINELVLYDFSYWWPVPDNAKQCLVLMHGAGGGGSGGESRLANYHQARPSMSGVNGGAASQCIFTLNCETTSTIELTVGVGGKGGESDHIGNSGTATCFGDWVVIQGGFAASYSPNVPPAQIYWRASDALSMSSFSTKNGKQTQQDIQFGNIETSLADSKGGMGGDGTNGFININWF